MLAMAGGALGLAGWWVDAEALRSVVPGLASMKANTATGMLLLGLALWWRGSAVNPRRPRMAAALVAVIVGATMFEYHAGLDLGLDGWLATDRLTDPLVSPPGRMSLATAQCLLLLALALVGIDGTVRRRIQVAEVLAILGGAGGAVGVIGYLVNFEALYLLQP